jgi:hypothetical protein
MKWYRSQGTSIRRLGLLLPLFVAAACSGASTSSSASGPATSASTGPGLTSLDGTPEGRGDHPGFRVEASHSWTLYKGFAVTSSSGGGFRGLSVWDVGKVARNSCHSIGHLYDPGPTVDDLVAALEAQSMSHATKPTDVTLAGYPGKYLQWSVPKDWVVTGDSDFAGCDFQPNGHRDFVSWLGAGGEGERWQQMAGQVDRFWILNVNGQRLVVDASYSPDTTQAQRDEEDRVVQSIQCVGSA